MKKTINSPLPTGRQAPAPSLNGNAYALKSSEASPQTAKLRIWVATGLLMPIWPAIGMIFHLVLSFASRQRKVRSKNME